MIVLPEIVSVGIYNAQLAFKNRTVSPNRKTTMFEIELPIEEGGVSYIDDTSNPITGRVVICAKPGQMRHTHLPFKCYYVHMVVTQGQLFDVLSALPNYIGLQDNSQVQEIFREMCRLSAAGLPEDLLILQSLILKLVHTLCREAPLLTKAHAPKANNEQVINRTLAYIGSNLTTTLTLEKLAEEAKFSPVYFHKLFKASTGKTLHDYIEEQRLKKAVELLISTDMTLTEIAYACGFSSQSYFSYAFKRRMGTSPRAYVKVALANYDTP
jgi:AraC-like DNA-binding protein